MRQASRNEYMARTRHPGLRYRQRNIQPATPVLIPPPHNQSVIPAKAGIQRAEQPQTRGKNSYSQPDIVTFTPIRHSREGGNPGHEQHRPRYKQVIIPTYQINPTSLIPEWPHFMEGCIRYRQSLDTQLPDAPRTEESYRGVNSACLSLWLTQKI